MNEKLRELLNKINACKTEVKTLAEAGKIEDAKAKKAELEEMQARFDILKDLDDNPSPQNPIPAGEPKDNAIHAFAEAARHRFRNEAGTNNESTPAATLCRRISRPGSTSGKKRSARAATLSLPRTSLPRPERGLT